MKDHSSVDHGITSFESDYLYQSMSVFLLIFTQLSIKEGSNTYGSLYTFVFYTVASKLLKLLFE